MHEEINDKLCYESDPPPKTSVPPVKNVGTPPSKVSVINIKEIKTKKSLNNISAKKFLSVEDLLKDNPHNIEKQLLEDWIVVRKTKRAAITPTAWKELNKKLTIIGETKGTTPVDAFTRMVASGWQSLDPKWFDSNPKIIPIRKSHDDDTSWAKQFHSTNSLGL
jgi:hypothetical protein